MDLGERQTDTNTQSHIHKARERASERKREMFFVKGMASKGYFAHALYGINSTPWNKLK